ncbi:MAG: FG-GAP repeat domain-containing protein, partial [Haliscomenobacter sp.]
MGPGRNMASRRPGKAVSAALLLALMGACKPNGPAPLFEELPRSQTGVSFSNDLTENEAFNLIEYLYFYNGGGVALGDINNDGLVDIYFSANQKENALYLNRGNWQFENITQQAGVASPGGWKTGVTMADVNCDGLLDIYQCRLGDYKGIQGRNQLFLNNGDLTFSEQAAAYGLDFKGFSTHSAFLDYDLDGDLDMYLLNHSVHTERSYGRAALRAYEDPKAGDRLYRNDNGHFEPLTREAGIYSSHIGYGLGVGVADVNNDGWPDLYVSNDFSENDYLYLNNGEKTGDGPAFREVMQQSIGHTSRFSMGNDLADYNNDGWVDILSLDMLPQDEVVIKRSAGDDPYEIYDLKLKFGYGRQFTRNTLQLNAGVREDGLPVFSEIGQIAGVHATDWSWSALFADYDLDGWRDLFISNGIRRRPNDMDYINFISNEEAPGGLKNNPDLSDKRLVDEMPDGAVPNYFFKNKGDLTFRDVSREWGMDSPTLSNGAAYADLDNDGDLD